MKHHWYKTASQKHASMHMDNKIHMQQVTHSIAWSRSGVYKRIKLKKKKKKKLSIQSGSAEMGQEKNK